MFIKETRYYKGVNIMKKKEDIACLNCGKMFHPARKESKFCCRECGIEYNKAHGKYAKTEEQKVKLSAAHIGKDPWNKGRKCTEEELKRMSETSKEFWAKKGFKEKMSQIQKESWSNKELLEKHSQIMHDSTSRPEVINKIKNGLREYYANVDPQVLTDRYIKQMQTKLEKGILYTSDGEKSITDYVKSLGFNPIKYVIGKGETRFEIDCYIPELKIGIEYNGIYYHAINGGNKKKRTYHINKSTFANDALGIDLIQIWEDQWKNQREIIEDIIAARLGIIRGEKIYARKCEIRDISTADYRDFCNKYHVQGYRSASVKLGLYYNSELVQIASFNRARTYGNNATDKYEWEWIRGCISSNNKVIGGTSKLLKHFIDTYKPNNILCFSDWNLFSGKGYEEAGFIFEGYTGPDKFYVTNSSKMVRINRNPYAYQQYKSMVNKGELFECYGCGSKKFVWYKD